MKTCLGNGKFFRPRTHLAGTIVVARHLKIWRKQSKHCFKCLAFFPGTSFQWNGTLQFRVFAEYLHVKVKFETFDSI